MVANTATYIFYYTAEPVTSDYGTLTAVPYDDADFRYRPDGNYVDRGDLKYSGLLGDYWEYPYEAGIRLTHKNGFDGVGVDIYVDGVKQNSSPLYKVTGQVYFEAHPNTLTTKILREVIVDRTYQDFNLQTGLDVWKISQG